MTPELFCAAPDCYQRLEAICQRDEDTAQETWLVTCRNPRCPMRDQTISAALYPPVNFDVYLKDGQRRRRAEERQARKAERLSERQRSIFMFVASASSIGLPAQLCEIAMRHHIRRSTARTELDHLEARGLITRTPGNRLAFQLPEIELAFSEGQL